MYSHPEWPAYSSIIVSNVFDCINQNSRVLEVGPYDGWFSELIMQRSPCYLELVEPNQQASDNLSKKYADNAAVKVVQADIFDMLKTYNLQSFDVVVAFGVLYHWHNPIEFLEQVVNVISPTYFCIDNVGAQNVYISDEELNIGGSRNIVAHKRTANLSLTLPGQVISKAMANLGYEEKFYRSMSDIQLPTKEDFNVWKFQQQ